jgi:hypothetical protein
MLGRRLVRWRMLCRRLVRGRMLGRRCCWTVFCVDDHCNVVLQAQLYILRVEGSRSLMYLFCSYVYSRLLSTILVVCNLRYEGSLIAHL